MGQKKRSIRATAEGTTQPPVRLEPHQQIAKVVRPEGSNLYSCILGSGEEAQFELDQKFRNTIWIRRGGFVLISLDQPSTSDEKRTNVDVKGDIINVVRDEKGWRRMPYWPKEFPKSTAYEDEDDHLSPRDMPPSDPEDEDV